MLETDLKMTENSISSGPLGWVKTNLSEADHTVTSDFLFFYYGVTALFISNILVCLPANLYVVWLIGAGAGGAAVTELFVLNLVVSEIISCILAFYLLCNFLLRMSEEVGFRVLQSTLQLMLMSRPIFQSCICLERYLAVVHPTVFLRFKPLRYRLACCSFMWLIILLYSVVPSVTLSATHSVYLLICMSSVVLVLMLYCGVHVLCVLKQPGPGEGSRNSMRRKAFKVIMIALVFTCTTQSIRVFILGPTVIHMSEDFTATALLVSLSISGPV